MLFKFGTFWKSLVFLIGTWIFYGIFNFEFTIITLLALIFSVHFKEQNNFF